MKKANRTVSADEIADMADRGEDVSPHFSNRGKKKYPSQRVNVDFNVNMLKELDDIASELNVSRQALVKTYLRQALDNHYVARQSQRE